MSGLFIAFEGIDGAGKETQLIKTRVWLKSLGYAVEWSSEPNDQSPLGRTIRSILKSKRTINDPVEFQRLYVLDRAQDIVSLVDPVLAENDIYLIERYGFSTISYGMLAGFPPETFIDMHKQILGSFLRWPDITLIIDITAEEAIRRITAGRDGVEFFEKQEKLSAIRKNYLSLVHHKEFEGKIAVVNGEQSEEKVFEEIQAALIPKLPKK